MVKPTTWSVLNPVICKVVKDPISVWVNDSSEGSDNAPSCDGVRLRRFLVVNDAVRVVVKADIWVVDNEPSWVVDRLLTWVVEKAARTAVEKPVTWAVFIKTNSAEVSAVRSAADMTDSSVALKPPNCTEVRLEI